MPVEDTIPAPRATRRAVLRTAVAGAAALPLFHIGRAQAAEFTLKLGCNVTDIHPVAIQLRAGADRVRQATGGRVDVQVFPNSQLGSDTDMLSQLRSGALEMMNISGLILSTLVPPSSINGVGFAFKDYDQVWAAMDGKLGDYVRREIRKRNLHVFDKMLDNGFRQTTSSVKPIQVPDDFKGMKIRVPPSPLWTSMFQALGAAPVTINFSETYSALQTRIADGHENPLTIIVTSKLYEVQKYCSMTNHMWDGFHLTANARVHDALPADVQAVLAREFGRAALDERADLLKLSQSARSVLEAKGMLINDVETAPFRETLKAAGFYQKWHATYGDEAWGLLEDAVGKVS